MAAGVDRATLCKPSDAPDVDRMIQTLEAHGLRGESHFKSTWDTRGIKSALKENGLSATDYDVKTLSIGLSRTKADAPVREILEKKMGQHIEAFMNESAKPEVSESLVDVSADLEHSDEQPGLKLA
jgi:hypothetical protein